ncbi:MAG: hypothetical protein KKD39_07120 [Candidatus Altiarchaeota archaeon]|nr:hypothetical protein [Candidatus Altiarchaeota archaeon]
MSEKRLGELQVAKLRAIIEHSYKNVPYYRGLFKDNDIAPSDITSLSDLGKLPIISKNDMLNAKRPVQSSEIRDYRLFRTSGTTGVPFNIMKSSREILTEKLIYLRSILSLGYGPLERHACIDIPKDRDFIFPFQKLGVFFTKYLNAFDSNEKLTSELNDFNPSVLSGLTSSLFSISKSNQIPRFDLDSLKFVLSSGEILTPSKRKSVEAYFDSRVYDLYFCEEFGQLMWETKEGGVYAANNDFFILEVLDENGIPSKEGRLVVTSLFHKTMPFIRYELGDCVSALKKSVSDIIVGAGVVRRIEGRQVDLIRVKDKTVSPYVLTCALESIDGLFKFQIQQSNLEIKVFYESSNDLGDQIKEIIHSTLGDDIVVFPINYIFGRKNFKLPVFKYTP